MIPLSALVGAARVFEYGSKKYAPGNFLLATIADGAAERYMGGFLRHALKMQDPSGTWTLASLAARDEESGHFELDHMICGLTMLRAILIKEGVLPADPGVGKEPPPK